MSEAKEEPIVCRLCGGPIGKVKGEREEVYNQELAQKVHHSCSEEHEAILLKHKVRQEDYTSALFEAMTQMLRLERTDAMKAFTKRIEEATEETHEKFPYQAAMAQKAQPQPQQPLQTIEVKRALEKEEVKEARDGIIEE
jgi:hypothetical protein